MWAHVVEIITPGEPASWPLSFALFLSLSRETSSVHQQSWYEALRPFHSFSSHLCSRVSPQLFLPLQLSPKSSFPRHEKRVASERLLDGNELRSPVYPEGEGSAPR